VTVAPPSFHQGCAPRASPPTGVAASSLPAEHLSAAAPPSTPSCSPQNRLSDEAFQSGPNTRIPRMRRWCRAASNQRVGVSRLAWPGAPPHCNRPRSGWQAAACAQQAAIATASIHTACTLAERAGARRFKVPGIDSSSRGGSLPQPRSSSIMQLLGILLAAPQRQPGRAPESLHFLAHAVRCGRQPFGGAQARSSAGPAHGLTATAACWPDSARLLTAVPSPRPSPGAIARQVPLDEYSDPVRSPHQMLHLLVADIRPGSWGCDLVRPF